MIPKLLVDGDVGVELGVGVESSPGEVVATEDVVGSVSALVAVGDVTVDVAVETSVVVVAVSGIVPGSVFPLPPSTDSPPEACPIGCLFLRARFVWFCGPISRNARC